MRERIARADAEMSALRATQSEAEAIKQRQLAEVLANSERNAKEREIIARDEARRAAVTANEQATIARASEQKANEALDAVRRIDSSNAYYKAVVRAPGGLESASFSADGKKVLTLNDANSTESGPTVRVWDADNPQESLNVMSSTLVGNILQYYLAALP